MFGTGSQIHISVTGLGEPAGTQHSGLADGADILFARHSTQRSPLIGIIVVDLSGNAAGKLRAVEAVFVALQRLTVFLHTLFQVQSRADQRGVVSIAQGIVGRTGGLDGIRQSERGYATEGSCG